jgi:predicted DNA-binding transcriptional regulator YafY
MNVRTLYQTNQGKQWEQKCNRLEKIDQLLTKGPRKSSELQRLFGVSNKTILRDLEILRGFGRPIDFCYRWNEFFIQK